MKTKQKRKAKFLRDDIANIILTDRDCKEYVERIVSQTLNINQDLIEDTLTLCTSRILDLLLYYDKEELDKISLEEVAFEKGKEYSKIEIAKNLLELNIPLKDVMKATGLTKLVLPFYILKKNTNDYYKIEVNVILLI